jgi:hypothetical protein
MELKQIEEKKDLTFDVFKHKYEDHIEGKLDNTERNLNRPVTADGTEPDMDHAKAKKGSTTNLHDRTSPDRDPDELDKSHNKISINDQDKNASKLSDGNDDSKFELPDSCYLTMSVDLRVEDLDLKYNLVYHPTP